MKAVRLVRRDGRGDLQVSGSAGSAGSDPAKRTGGVLREVATGRGLSVKLLDSPVEGTLTEGAGV